MDIEEIHMQMLREGLDNDPGWNKPPIIYLMLEFLAAYLQDKNNKALPPDIQIYLGNVFQRVVDKQGSVDEELKLVKSKGRPKNTLTSDIHTAQKVSHLIKSGSTVHQACDAVGQEIHKSPEAILKVYYRFRSIAEQIH